MVREDVFIRKNRQESIESADKVLDRIAFRAANSLPDASKKVAESLGLNSVTDIRFVHIATAIAEFIKDEHRISSYRFNDFLYRDSTSFSRDELDGGLIFYGKGRCATCHSGVHFTDFQYHSIALPELGSGKNGFGVDYGRFNVTHDPTDLYAFRTPPLINVAKTAPYGHSGGAPKLDSVIRDHFDPLRHLTANKAISDEDRAKLYQRIREGKAGEVTTPFLTPDEVRKLVSFLNTLTIREGS